MSPAFQQLFDNKKLGNLHGPVLFEIFKFLHSKHLLSSIVLVCSEWRDVVVECVLKLEIKEYNFKNWLQEQLDPFKADSKATYPCPHLQGYYHVERFVQSCTVFANLNDLTLAGHGDLFSFELFGYLVKELKDLKKLVLSDLCLYNGRYTRRLNKKSNSLQTTTPSSKKGFFSRFKKKKESSVDDDDAKEVPKIVISKDDRDLVVEFVRSDIDDVPLGIKWKANVENLQQLFLYKVNLGLENYEMLMKYLVGLKELRIVDCHLEKFKLKTNSKHLSHVELNFSNSNHPIIDIDESQNTLYESLTYLVLNHVECSMLPEFLAKCKNLKYLVTRKHFNFHLKSNLRIEHLTLESEITSMENIRSVLRYVPNLKSLEIINSSIDSGDEFISDVLKMPNIIRLALRNVKGIGGASVISQQLEYLELSSLYLAPDCKIECPSLNTLILNSSSSLLDSSKSTAVMISREIRVLGLSMLNSNEGIASATALGNLTKLDFSYNRKLKSERLREILSFIPKLEFLNLKMTGIGGGFIPYGSKLKTLLLSGSTISNDELNEIAKSCLDLNRLDIDCCHLTCIDLSCLHKLNSLDLSETTMKLDDILACIDSVPSLRHLYLRWITQEQSSWKEQTVMNKFRNLLFLDVTGSYLSKPQFLETITRNFKDLIVVPKTQMFRYETAINPFVNYC